MRRADFERALPVLQHAQNLNPADPSILGLLRRARSGQTLEPPPPIPTPVAPASMGRYAPGESLGYALEEQPTRVAGEIDMEGPSSEWDEPALGRVRLERVEQRREGRRAPVEQPVRRSDARGRDEADRRPVEHHMPPPTEDVFAPLGQDPVRERRAAPGGVSGLDADGGDAARVDADRGDAAGRIRRRLSGPRLRSGGHAAGCLSAGRLSGRTGRPDGRPHGRRPRDVAGRFPDAGRRAERRAPARGRGREAARRRPGLAPPVGRGGRAVPEQPAHGWAARHPARARAGHELRPRARPALGAIDGAHLRLPVRHPVPHHRRRRRLVLVRRAPARRGRRAPPRHRHAADRGRRVRGPAQGRHRDPRRGRARSIEHVRGRAPGRGDRAGVLPLRRDQAGRGAARHRAVRGDRSAG